LRACSIESDDGGGCAEVTAHFGPGDDPADAVAAAAQAAGLAAAPGYSTELVPPQTWTQTIEDSYQPLCVVPASQQPAGVAVLPPAAVSQSSDNMPEQMISTVDRHPSSVTPAAEHPGALITSTSFRMPSRTL